MSRFKENLYTKKENFKNSTRKDALTWMMNNAIFLVLIGLLIIIIFVEPDFISLRNFRNILSQASTRIIMALGVGGIIVAKGTDLSLGRQVGLAAVVSASLLQSPDYAYRMYPNLPQFHSMYPNLPQFHFIFSILQILFVILFVMIITGCFGLINGFVVSKLKVDPFIATLGMMIIVYGVNSIYFDRPPYGAQPIGGLDPKFTYFAQGSIDIGRFNIPFLVIYAAFVTALIWVLWNKTTFGKNIFAIGGNEEAAIVSGVNVVKYLLLVYMLAGFLYGLGGALEAARIGTATNNTGNGYELDAISACIVGGLSFSGGIGTVAGIVIGVLIFQVIAYGLSFIGINPYMQFIIKGLIIITAVAIDSRKYVNRK